HWSVGHWSESPALFERLKPELAAAGSMVFRDLSVFELFVLLMLRRFDVLADKLDWWEPLDHEEKVRLLQYRVQPAPIAAHEHAPQRRPAAPRQAHEPTSAHSALGQP
ncbi:fatty acid desaturase, partial [Bacillus cereus]